MTHRTPLLTLAAVALFFAALLTANYLVNPPTTGTTPPAVGSAGTGAPSEPALSNSPAPAAGSATAEPTPEVEDAQESAAAETLPDQVVYAGRSEDRSLAVAIAVKGDRAAAYLCDGASREAWLSGSVEGSEITVISRGGYRLTARLDDGRLEGTVRGGGRRWEFAIPPADPPAGIYRAKSSGSTIGWIRLPDGSVVGVATDPQGNSQPAPQLSSDDSATVDGRTVEANVVAGDSDI